MQALVSDGAHLSLIRFCIKQTLKAVTFEGMLCHLARNQREFREADSEKMNLGVREEGPEAGSVRIDRGEA